MGVEVSVVIPMHNSEDLIGKCIDSILDSTFQDFEIICVDDGSVDNTVKRVQERYDDPRIRIICKPNGGVSSARNTGIDNANGKLIAFVDSDDYISGEYIEKLRNSCAYSDIAICGYFKVTTDVSKPVEATDFEGSLEEYCNSCLVSSWSTGVLFSPWNKMFRLAIIRENNLHFDESISILEDIDFCLRYMKCCSSIISLRDELYYYVCGGGY